MKKAKMFFNCVVLVIKKKFFKMQKTNISQECEKVLNFSEKEEPDTEIQREEYLKNYNITTRWQTV